MNTQTLDLHHETITVAALMMPKPGKKNAKVEDSQGRVFDVWDAAIFRQLREGYSYDFGFTAKQGEHLTFLDVKTVVPVAVKPQPPARSVPVSSPTVSNNGNGRYQSLHVTSKRDAKQMWVARILGDLIRACRITEDFDSVRLATKQLCQIWEESFSGDYPENGV